MSGQLLHAIGHLRAGLGCESSPPDIEMAADCLVAASRQIDQIKWAIEEVGRLAYQDDRDDPMARHLRLTLAAVETGSNAPIG